MKTDDEIEKDICNDLIRDIYYREDEESIHIQIEKFCKVQLTENDKVAFIAFLPLIAMAITINIIKNRLPRKSNNIIKRLYEILNAEFIKMNELALSELNLEKRWDLERINRIKKNVELFQKVALISTANTYIMVLTEKFFENFNFEKFDVKNPTTCLWFSDYMIETGRKVNAVLNAAKEQHKYSLE